MRYVKTASLVILLAALVFVLAPGKSTNAGSAGEIASVCTVEGRTQMAVWALGDENDGGGLDYIGAQVDGILLFTTIPADGEYHLAEFTFNTVDLDLSLPVVYCAGNASGPNQPTAPGFDGCDAAVLQSCTYEAVPVPDDFVLRALSCGSPVLDEPAGKQVDDAAVEAGQTWWVNPVPVKGIDGISYTEIFVAGPYNGFIPTACVGGPTPFSAE
jgi:hypothetical protein